LKIGQIGFGRLVVICLDCPGADSVISLLLGGRQLAIGVELKPLPLAGEVVGPAFFYERAV
jgi:hypothetical protein